MTTTSCFFHAASSYLCKTPSLIFPATSHPVFPYFHISLLLMLQCDLMKYDNNNLLIFTARDSHISEVYTEEFSAKMWRMSHEFDLACYANRSPFYYSSNKMVLGQFRVEACRSSILDPLCLKPKMYFYQTLTDPSVGEAAFTTKKRAKGKQRPGLSKRHHVQHNALLAQAEEAIVP